MTACVEISHLYKTYQRRSWLFGKQKSIPVLTDVNLTLPANRVIGLVGESGCGKSTLCKVLLGIEQPTAGTVRIAGQDTATLSRAQRKKLCQVMQVVYQDPYGSLDPRMTVRQLLSEPLDIHHLQTDSSQREKFLIEALKAVGLSQVYLDRYPHEFSGGQRQRICIARALVLNPQILIADEPVSALDVSVQAQILNLLHQIKRTRQLSMLFVTHDLAVARFLCDDIAVMYQGRIVEYAPAATLLSEPLHPYTQRLLAAVPEVGKPVFAAPAQAASSAAVQLGCSFAPRCERAEEACTHANMNLIQAIPGHWCACAMVTHKEKTHETK